MAKKVSDSVFEQVAVFEGQFENLKPEADEPVKELTPSEKAALAVQEKVIEKGLSHWQQVGEALLVIEENKLYRPHNSLSAYAFYRFELSRNDVSRYKKAAKVCRNLKAAGLPEPKREAQARALAGLPAEKQVETWARIREETDSLTIQAVQDHLPKKEGEKEEPQFVLRVFVATHDLTTANQLAALLGEEFKGVSDRSYGNTPIYQMTSDTKQSFRSITGKLNRLNKATVEAMWIEIRRPVAA